jgi:hypothetical protein
VLCAPATGVRLRAHRDLGGSGWRVRRRHTEDGVVEATVVADFVVMLLLDGLRPRPKGDRP